MPISISIFLLNERFQPLTTLRDADDFCDLNVVNDVIDAKSICDSLRSCDVREARKRANPYEEIMGAMYQNRHVFYVNELKFFCYLQRLQNVKSIKIAERR